MEIPAPQFAFGDTVEPTSDQAIRPKSRVGRVEGRRWVMDPVSGPAHWRCTVRWPEGGTSDQPEKTLQAADLVMCDLKVVVSGAPFKIETSTTATVEELIELATAKAGIPHPDTPQNPTWELRTEDGRKLTHLVGDAGLVDGETTLFLDPEVGGGGESGGEVVESGYLYPGWQGTPPAEGTRRKLIFDTLAARIRATGPAGEYVDLDEFALELADRVEAALLSIDEREDRRASMERLDVSAEESNSRGGRELHIVLGPNPDRRDPSSMVFFEIENEKGVSVGGFDRREVDGRTHIVIPVPYPVGPVGVKCERGGTHAWPRNPRRDGRSCLKCGVFPEEAALMALTFRDDGWVSEVVYQAAGAATRPLMEDHPDYVFPSERVRDAVAELLKDFGIARACRGCAEEELEHGAKEVDGRRDDTIKGLKAEAERLLEGRESARAGEDHFKAQRDSALHLVRWLIGDIIPPDLIRFQADDEEAR